MKKLANIVEVDGEGLVGLLGEKVTVFCMNYIYTGVLAGVNNSEILLEEPRIVYETGAFSDKKFADAQSIGSKALYIRMSAIESYAVLPKD